MNDNHESIDFTTIKGAILITIAGERLLLLPDKAIYLVDHRILLVSDLHIGKISHFRKHGIGIPHKAALDNFERLSLLVDSIDPLKVLFLGDLFHSTINSEWTLLKDFIRSRSDIEFVLILGNHDILDENVYQKSAIRTCLEYQIGKIILTHEPLATIPDDTYNIYGHIHPAIKLRGRGKQSLRLPCYIFREKDGIMPAFGTFTGMYTINCKVTDQVFVIGDQQVLAVN